MTRLRPFAVPVLLAASIAACSDGAGNSLSTGVGGMVKTEYGRVSR